MQPLFETGPVYDPHIKSIIKLMLLNLKNNKPKEDSKVYVRTVSYIQELYDGTFLHRSFNTGRTDYNYQGSFDKIKSCKGSWQNIKNCITDSLTNLNLAKQNEYLPYNKSFLDGISFATFFEQWDITSNSTNCNFLNFQNPPKKKLVKALDSKIQKTKKNVLNLIIQESEKIALKYYQDENDKLQFWCAIENFSRWLRQMKSTFPSIYSEFIVSCKNGNPLTDFRDYVETLLIKKQGQNIVIAPYYFRLSIPGQNKLGGSFLDWLVNGISTGKFSCFKSLPKSIMNYCNDSDFVESTVLAEKKLKIEIETVIF